MCDICTARAKKIAQLARFFHEKADETVLTYYVEKMNEAAASLDHLAKDFSTRCRCGDDLSQHSEGPVEFWHRERAQGSGGKHAATRH